MDAGRHADAAHRVAADALSGGALARARRQAPSPIPCWRRRPRSSPPKPPSASSTTRCNFSARAAIRASCRLERMARDVRMFTIGGGTAQVLRTLVACKMLGWKLPQTRDGYRPKARAARRRGVTMHPIFVSAGAQAVPILFVTAANFDEATQILDARERAFVTAAGFEPKPGKHLIVPDAEGRLAGVLFGLEDADDPARDLFRPGALAGAAAGRHLPFRQRAARRAAGRARLRARQLSVHALPQGQRRATSGWRCRRASTARTLIAHRRSRDALPRSHQHAVERHGAGGDGGRRPHARRTAPRQDRGDQRRGAGARAFRWSTRSARARHARPRLIDITWGKEGDPKITLVGKGVAFDTGGLDIKPSSGMLNMKKDMGGAATALALGHMIMAARLKVRLRMIVPAVENSISGASFRPRDVYRSRKGISVEIGNTDAEGRLVLADALALADEDKPALIVDFATLTGAARVALGPDAGALLHRRRCACRRADGGGRRASSIRCGACRCGGLTTPCSIPRWPTSTMSAPAATAAPSPPRCSCAASSRRRRGCISTFSPGRRRPGRPAGRRRAAVGARALCVAESALC